MYCCDSTNGDTTNCNNCVFCNATSASIPLIEYIVLSEKTKTVTFKYRHYVCNLQECGHYYLFLENKTSNSLKIWANTKSYIRYICFFVSSVNEV